MANWQWFHRLGSPKWLLATLDRWLPWLLSLGLLMLVGALAWGLAFVPPDYKQGNSFRIMYIHVPTAVVALAAYYAMAIAGAVAMIWRMKADGAGAGAFAFTDVAKRQVQHKAKDEPDSMGSKNNAFISGDVTS